MWIRRCRYRKELRRWNSPRKKQTLHVWEVKVYVCMYRKVKNSQAQTGHQREARCFFFCVVYLC